MLCSTCGNEVEDDAKFCPECGSKLDPQSTKSPEEDKSAEEAAKTTDVHFHKANSSKTDAPDEPSDATPSVSTPPDPAQTTAPLSPDPVHTTAPSSLLKNKKVLGIGIGVVAVVIIVAIVAFVVIGSGVSEDQVRQDVARSTIVSSGLAPNAYVNESPYELTEFKITDQKKESATLLGSNFKGSTVTFSGTVKNANFESTFTGTASYLKQGDSWQLMMPPTASDKTTTPLKGVDTISKSQTLPNGDTTVSDFESDLKESNGSYSSTASQASTYDTWFASDSVTTTQEFVFDNTAGWKTIGQPQTDIPETTYKLQGKSFSYANTATGTVECKLTFKDIASDGTATADYSLKYTPNKEDTSYMQYHASDTTGTAKGKLIHEAGKTSFSVELNDADHAVTLTCSNGISAMQAGSGKVNALSVSLASHIEYYTSKYGSPGTLQFNYATFPEAASA